MQKSKQFLQFLKSLKFRLILLIVVIAVVPSLILSAAVLKYYEKRAVSIRESEILSQAKILANQIATSEYMKLAHIFEISFHKRLVEKIINIIKIITYMHKMHPNIATSFCIKTISVVP